MVMLMIHKFLLNLCDNVEMFTSDSILTTIK